MKEKGVHRADAFRRRQTDRRMWVQDRIERGRAIIDRLGGIGWKKWRKTLGILVEKRVNEKSIQ